MSLIKEKIEECCHGLQPYCYQQVTGAGDKNGLTICNYILAVKSETDLSDNYRRNIIGDLSRLSRFFKNIKTFDSLQREHIVRFLNQYRKADNEDPMHKWIGTYNIVLVRLIRFFKWLYYPNDTDRPKPPVIRNIGRLRRKEQSIYKPSDLWTEEHLIFTLLDSCHHIIHYVA